MAWSPPALECRSWLVEQAGDYATPLSHHSRDGTTNNACERDLRPCVIQRKVTNGYRAMWAAQGEADIRSVAGTARLTPGTSVFSAILQTVTA